MLCGQGGRAFTAPRCQVSGRQALSCGRPLHPGGGIARVEPGRRWAAVRLHDWVRSGPHCETPGHPERASVFSSTSPGVGGCAWSAWVSFRGPGLGMFCPRLQCLSTDKVL